jgi:hypothetical protein
MMALDGRKAAMLLVVPVVALAWGTSSGSGRAQGAVVEASVRSLDIDVDGDGRVDLVIGATGFVGFNPAIQVLYGDGGRQRLRAAAVRPIRLLGGFGAAIAGCDVNRDGYSDAVVGAPAAASRAVVAGAVVVLYGSNAGLSARRSSIITQATAGVPGRSEIGDEFGASVGCGRTNRDRFDDVVVGAPGETRRAGEQMGQVTVVPGSRSGVVATGAWIVNENTPGVLDRAEFLDRFGNDLVVDDVTGDGMEELIVVAPGERVAQNTVGALFVLHRRPASGRLEGAVIRGGSDGLPVITGPVVAGNFNRRGQHDVVFHTFDPLTVRGGAVTMLRGTPTGVATTGGRTIERDSAGMPPLRGLGLLGESLAAGDVDGDGDDDLLAASTLERVSGIDGAGKIFVLRGAAGGITTDGVQLFSQRSPGVPGRPHVARFGRCVALLDRTGDGRSEAVVASDEGRVGTPPGPLGDLGAITILRGTVSGLTGQGARRLNASDLGAEEEDGVGFGCELAG